MGAISFYFFGPFLESEEHDQSHTQESLGGRHRSARLSVHQAQVDKPSEALLSDTTATFRILRALQESCGSDTNKHDIVAVLIVACITEGFNIKPRIIGALMKLGLSNKHVARVLDGNPANKWRLEGGIYVLQP